MHQGYLGMSKRNCIFPLEKLFSLVLYLLEKLVRTLILRIKKINMIF